MFSTQTQRSGAKAHKPDPRPRFGIGHVSLTVTNVDEAADFYEKAGMRPIVNMGRMAILELRGGTHLIVHEGDHSPGSIDLIVDDIDETHELLATHGANPSPIQRGNPHDRFFATDPAGNRLVVNSNHAMGPV